MSNVLPDILPDISIRIRTDPRGLIDAIKDAASNLDEYSWTGDEVGVARRGSG